MFNDTNPVTILHEDGSDDGVTFVDNIIYTSGTGSIGDLIFTADGATNIDPLLESSDCLVPAEDCGAMIPYAIYKLTSSSSAIDAALSETYDYIKSDIEGQLTVGIRDLGCDEYNAEAAITSGVLGAEHVGPDAIEGFSEKEQEEEEEEEEDVLEIDAVNLRSKIEMYHNPFIGTIKISLDDQAEISVFDISGSLIDSFSMNGAYNWSAPRSGVSIVHVITRSGERLTVRMLAE